MSMKSKLALYAPNSKMFNEESKIRRKKKKGSTPIFSCFIDDVRRKRKKKKLRKCGKNLWMDYVREPKYLPSSKTLHAFMLIVYCMILIIITQIGEIYEETRKRT